MEICRGRKNTKFNVKLQILPYSCLEKQNYRQYSSWIVDSQKSKTQLALSINQYFSEVNYSEEPMKIPGEVGFGNLGGSKAFN